MSMNALYPLLQALIPQLNVVSAEDLQFTVLGLILPFVEFGRCPVLQGKHEGVGISIQPSKSVHGIVFGVDLVEQAHRSEDLSCGTFSMLVVLQ